MAPGVGAENCLGAVCGGVIVHENLHAKVRLLRKKAVQRLGDIGRVVIRRATDADHGFHAATSLHADCTQWREACQGADRGHFPARRVPLRGKMWYDEEGKTRGSAQERMVS